MTGSRSSGYHRPATLVIPAVTSSGKIFSVYWLETHRLLVRPPYPGHWAMNECTNMVLSKEHWIASVRLDHARRVRAHRVAEVARMPAHDQTSGTLHAVGT